MNYMRGDGRGAMTCGFRREVQIYRLIGSPFAPRIGAIEANMNTSGADAAERGPRHRSLCELAIVTQPLGIITD